MITVLLFITLTAPLSSLFAQETTPSAEARMPAVSPTAAPATAPPEERPTGEFAVAAMSQYFWRGYELSRNSVVIQPSITMAFKGFSANLWGNMDIKPYASGATDPNYANTWNETDFTVTYTKTIGPFNIGGGYIYYALGALNRDALKRADAQEFFATASLNTILSPTLSAYKEVGSYQNWYFTLGASHVIELSKMFSLKIEAMASYLLSTYADATRFNAGAGYGGYPKFDKNSVATNEKFNNFHDGKIALSLPIKATSNISLTPSIAWIFPLSDDARYEMKGQGLKGAASAADRDSSFLAGGITVSFAY
jgi:hypothetical protein